ncbi:nucleoid-associated protein [Amycolatopsis rhabdoformis]|uniref:Nucleoid-associated protein n=1 Tax=Amycolatopsis rhabdoformis TaxID=1448059 RepID=A0ABZ1IHS9_9PSEU|nr:nucleoid-associated protein [Amycolatopsis rhabdoformis]WSE33213.1 nucleoid-associated protein [Amycolatopsis rhabdoformis]
MAIEMLTYDFVDASAEVGRASLRDHDESIEEFLYNHFKQLVKRVEKGDTPCATFHDDEARALFRNIEKGDEEEFLDGATQLMRRLVGTMDGRTAPGLLVFARFSEGEGTSTAILKLEVVSKFTGVLRQIADGSQSLETVRDVLDSPGNIQKGVITPDRRDDSDVIVGDRLNKAHAADYFVRAFGLTVDARPAEAALSVIQVVSKEIPEATNKVVATLPLIGSGPLDETIEALVQQVPELEPKRQVIEELLREQQRPIRRVDTTAGFKQKITVGSVTITGPATILDSTATIEANPQEGWTVSVTSLSEPVRNYFK